VIFHHKRLQTKYQSGTGLTFDFALAVLDAEIARLIMYFKNGIEVNENTLSDDIIHEIGPLGNFLGHGSTIDKMRSLSQTQLFNRGILSS